MAPSSLLILNTNYEITFIKAESPDRPKIKQHWTLDTVSCGAFLSQKPIMWLTL